MPEVRRLFSNHCLGEQREIPDCCRRSMSVVQPTLGRAASSLARPRRVLVPADTSLEAERRKQSLRRWSEGSLSCDISALTSEYVLGCGLPVQSYLGWRSDFPAEESSSRRAAADLDVASSVERNSAIRKYSSDRNESGMPRVVTARPGDVCSASTLEDPFPLSPSVSSLPSSSSCGFRLAPLVALL